MTSWTGSDDESRDEEFDMVIVGAGIAGINTARYVERYTPGTTYTVLEGRANLGGTWDLFKYPGIRSDSDIWTFGFSWNPWQGDRPLVEAHEIRRYLRESATKAGVANHIRYNTHVTTVSWSSKEKLWTLETEINGESKSYRARFVVLGTGYYDYDNVFQTTIPGLERFKGDVIQAQFWPKELDYSGKEMVVIGSGATAVTIVPSVAPKVKHVTMLQRSPTFMISLPQKKPLPVKLLSWLLPRFASAAMVRWYNIMWQYLLYVYCRWLPRSAKSILVGEVAKQLPANVPVNPHFTPNYYPWDQRVCAVPDGDFFQQMHAGKASVVTDTIDTVTEDEILLKSGQKLRPDIIVQATGIKLRFGGGIQIFIDGNKVNPGEKYAWRGCMIQDVPNLSFVAGYANASWTLGAEAASTVLIRIWKLMMAKGIRSATPRLPPGTKEMQKRGFFDLDATYLKDAMAVWPNSGEGQWTLNYNYIKDITNATWGNITGVMEFR